MPRKRFGQHFLHDPGIIRRIVEAIGPRPDDVMVEIGPGLGALTRPLLERLGHLHVLEIDRDIIARLKSEFPPEKLTIHEGDALKFDFARLGGRIRVVGNLPYNISSPLLFHMADHAGRILDCCFMLQKEVVERMVAEPGSSEYGRLSVMLQYRFGMEKLFIVHPGAFNPPPKVDSAIVHLAPLRPLPFPARDEKRFAEIVSAAFSQRRKMLRNTLRAYFTAEDWAALGMDPQRRAEELGVAEFVALANYIGTREKG